MGLSIFHPLPFISALGQEKNLVPRVILRKNDNKQRRLENRIDFTLGDIFSQDHPRCTLPADGREDDISHIVVVDAGCRWRSRGEVS